MTEKLDAQKVVDNVVTALDSTDDDASHAMLQEVNSDLRKLSEPERNFVANELSLKGLLPDIALETGLVSEDTFVTKDALASVAVSEGSTSVQGMSASFLAENFSALGGGVRQDINSDYVKGFDLRYDLALETAQAKREYGGLLDVLKQQNPDNADIQSRDGLQAGDIDALLANPDQLTADQTSALKTMKDNFEYMKTPRGIWTATDWATPRITESSLDEFVDTGVPLGMRDQLKIAEREKSKQLGLEAAAQQAQDERLTPPAVPKETPPAQAETPPVQPEVPPVQPETPPVQPETPPVQPEVPPVQPETPPVQPEVPPVQPETPPVQPETPPVQPEVPPVQPETPPVQPEVPPVQPETPPVQPETPPVQPETPPVQPETPPVQPEVSPVQPETPPVQPETPPVQPEVPPVQPETPPVQPETPPVQPEAPPVQPETPPVQPETPPVQPEAPPVQPETPPVQPETPPVQPDAPQAPPDNPGDAPPSPESMDRDNVTEKEIEVQKGDNLWKIARAHLTEKDGKRPSNAEVLKLVNQIIERNQIQNPNLIYPGQKFIIPGETAPQEPAPPSSPEI